jgi:glutathione S-transferase
LDYDKDVRRIKLQKLNMLLTWLRSNIMTNEQKKEWFLRLNPNGLP